MQSELPAKTTSQQFSAQFKKPKNKEVREREYLTTAEIESLLVAVKKMKRYAHRNYCLILLGYRHGLRISEACNLRWSQVDFKSASLHVTRLKNGKPAVHPIDGAEMRALKQLQKKSTLPFVFESERGTPLSPEGVRRIINIAGKLAGFDFPIHFHMLRHSCGYALANKGVDTRVIQDYLGHKSITCTTIYTQLSPQRFQGLWDK